MRPSGYPNQPGRDQIQPFDQQNRGYNKSGKYDSFAGQDQGYATQNEYYEQQPFDDDHQTGHDTNRLYSRGQKEHDSYQFQEGQQQDWTGYEYQDEMGQYNQGPR